MVKLGYKQTEVGEIPDDWETKTLAEICRQISDGTHYTPKYVSVGIPFYSVENITSGDFVNTKFISQDEHKRLIKRCKPERGDVLMTRITAGVVGDTKLIDWDVDASIYVSLALLKLNDSILPSYFYRYTKSTQFLKDVEKRSLVNATPKKINMENIGAIPVPVPKKTSEQEAIARALSDVDALVSSMERLIAKKRDIKTATMQQLLTGKKRLPGFGEGKGYKQTELGEIPEDWEVKYVGDLLSITTGDKNTQDKVDDGRYPFFVRSQKVEKINSYSFDGEGVLTAGDGVGTGKVFHYINGKCDYHQRVYLMHSFAAKLDGKFFYIYFSNYFYDRIMSMTAKSSVDSVRQEMISKMQIFLPPINEQEAISGILVEMDRELKLIEERLRKTQAIRQGMMQELLTGRTRLIDIHELVMEEERLHGT